jgi:trehalose synthase
MPLDRYAAVLCADQLEAVQAGVLAARSAFAGRTIWNVSSTAQGGGVAEMLKTLLPYARGAGVDARWRVIGAGPEFFAVTKRIHNRLHGFAGDGGPLGDAEREQYEAALAPCAAALTEIVNARDIVILHDPQTVGLAPALSDLGVSTIWRCHVGVDQPNEIVRETWSFLEPYVHATRAAVFSRAAFVWSGVDRAHVSVIMPTLDAFAPKNQALEPAAVAAILHAAGIRLGAPSARALYERRDGSEGIVGRRALVVEDRPLRHGEAYVLQVSRWDALKDHAGVIAGFAEHVAPTSEAHLVCAGPEIDGVSDDPEGARVLADVIAAHARLDPAIRERVHLAVLPMDDPQENAATVNALQRAAAIVVQKSIAEGFGLTVAEAMWKARPVIASRIGGIQDQIEDGRSGLLLDDARDLEAFGAAVRRLLADSEEAETLASAARERVRERFLAPRSLLDYLKVLETVAGA